MSLQRLRRILDSSLTIDVDSSQGTMQRIQDKIASRANDLLAQQKVPPDTKTPIAVTSLAGVPSVTIRPIDLLRKIGDLTTPSDVNMAKLSASWATRRYFWAIAEPLGQNQNFRLSKDARTMDFHQKTLLSDEFGIGLGGLLVERFFNAGIAIDVSEALRRPGEHQDVQQSGAAQPDYLMWDPAPNTPYYVVECKGCQTSRDAVIDQLRRGLEQVRTLIFGTGARPVITLVVASHMQALKTTVYFVDPPKGPPDENGPSESDATSERIDRNTWKIGNAEAFGRIAQSTKQTKLLNWAGQYASASRLLASAWNIAPDTAPGPDLPLTRRTIRDVAYSGRRVSLFPELGHARLRMLRVSGRTSWCRRRRARQRPTMRRPTYWQPKPPSVPPIEKTRISA
jgi:hypothetical protein